MDADAPGAFAADDLAPFGDAGRRQQWLGAAIHFVVDIHTKAADIYRRLLGTIAGC